MTTTCRREAMELARLEVKLCSIRGSNQGTRSPIKSLAGTSSPVGMVGGNICLESPTRMVGSSSNNPVGWSQTSPPLAAPSAAR